MSFRLWHQSKLSVKPLAWVRAAAQSLLDALVHLSHLHASCSGASAPLATDGLAAIAYDGQVHRPTLHPHGSLLAIAVRPEVGLSNMLGANACVKHLIVLCLTESASLKLPLQHSYAFQSARTNENCSGELPVLLVSSSGHARPTYISRRRKQHRKNLVPRATPRAVEHRPSWQAAGLHRSTLSLRNIP